MKNKPDSNSKKKRSLNDNEQALWHQVKRTVTPIDDKRQNLTHWLDWETEEQTKSPGGTQDHDPFVPSKPAISDNRKYFSPSYSPPVSKPKTVSSTKGLAGSIDDKIAKKLLKGRLSIDARIDLHGMTQMMAHTVLKNFLYESHHSGYRMVLVITGKGRMSQGVLRQSVPAWLKEPPLSLYASAFRTSHVTHGGEGALYVRIRKR